MDRNQAKEFYPILQAFAEGRVIECRTKPSAIKGKDIPNDWTEMKDITYWSNIEYRIKPDSKAKAKYRPFANAKECWQEMQKHQPFGWVKCVGCCYNIVSVSNIDVSMANVSGDIVTLRFCDVMESDTFADGLPFGVKVEEE